MKKKFISKQGSALRVLERKVIEDLRLLEQKKNATARKRLFEKDRRQHRLLNALRLAYFLHPDKVMAEGVNEDNCMEYVSSVYKKCGWRDESSDGEMMFYILSNISWHSIIRGRIGPGYSETDAEKEISNHIKSFSRHWYSPENVPIYSKGTLPKIVDLDATAKKVISYHQFELAKCRAKLVNVRRSPTSYADIIEHQKNFLGISKQEAEKQIRVARKREKQFCAMEKKGQLVDDKVIAHDLYGKVSSQTLARVRQDRLRLRKYGFL